MPLVFLTPYKKTYSSEFCSLSTFIGFIFLILTLLIPLFAAFSSEDFWLRLKEYLEEPKVEYSSDFMLYITTLENPKTFFSSSNTKLNDNFNQICTNDLNNCELLEIQTPSVEYDEIKNKIMVTYEINKDDINNSNKTDIKLILFLKYRLMKQVKVLMTPMVYLNIPVFNSGGKEIILNGELELVQKSPIVSTTITSQIYNYENDVFHLDQKLYSPFDMLYFYNKYKNLNYTLKYNYETIERSAEGSLKIKIEMNIPKLQKVFYIQSVFEAIKYAWMQYFYIFLPIYIILYMIYKYIIESNIFYSHAKSDL